MSFNFLYTQEVVKAKETRTSSQSQKLVHWEQNGEKRKMELHWTFYIYIKGSFLRHNFYWTESNH